MEDSQTYSARVTEVRRCLQAVRTNWQQNHPERPMNLTATLPSGEEMHAFCYRFVLSHHNKRMRRLQPGSPCKRPML